MKRMMAAARRSDAQRPRMPGALVGACGLLFGAFLQGGALLANGAVPAAQSHAVAAKSDERLIDQFGHRVSPTELEGHWLLIYFGYADCPDLCPASLTRMRQILDAFGRDGGKIQPLFVSVDPLRDTPARLKEFAARFHPRLRALTGSEAAIADAARTFGVPVSRAAKGSIDHGVMTYLAGPDGRVVAVLHPEQPLADNLAQIRRALLTPRPGR